MHKYNYSEVRFYTTVNDLKSLPNRSICEIAIVGRSNVGKSSLLNTLTNRNKLAFTSKTPGRTQHINYFAIKQDQYFLVDLPGYGYARVPKPIINHWINLLENYLTQRKSLRGLILIMDARHPLKDLDLLMLDFIMKRRNNTKPVHMVLSKADKLNTSEKNNCLKFVQQHIIQHNLKDCSTQLFSATKKLGIEELELTLNKWFNCNDS